MTKISTLRRFSAAVAVGALLAGVAPASAADTLYDANSAVGFFLQDAPTAYRGVPETTGSIGFVVDRCDDVADGLRLDFVGGCESNESPAEVAPEVAQAPAPTRADPIDVPNSGWSTYDPGLDRGVPED